MGRSPNLVEDQITYPIVTTFLAAPKVKVVRGFTMFGMSFVYILFEDGTDIYWARSRVLEYLVKLQGRLPPGVAPQIGPDATGVGWVFEYALVYDTGWKLTEAPRDPRWIAQLCMAKNFATRAMQFCADEAVQTLGGAGFIRGSRAERVYREVKVMQIGGGAEEIMKDLAARQLGW